MKKALSAAVLVMLTMICGRAWAAEITLSSPQNNQTLHEGEEILCSAQLSGTDDAYKVKIYVDGSLAKEFSAKESLSCSVTGIGSGVHTVRADAEDVLGKVISQTEASVNVEANGAPQISAEMLDGSGKVTIDISEQSFLEVSVSDAENNFSHADVSLNGENIGTFGESSFAVDIGSAAAGDNIIEIAAYDEYGNKSVYEKVFGVKRKIEAVLTENDFEKYSGGTPAGFLNFVTGKGGSYAAVTTDIAERGTSMAMRVEQQATQNDVDPNIHYELPDRFIKYVIEASFMLPGGEGGNYDATATLRCRNSNGSELKILEFSRDGKIRLLGSGGELEPAAADGEIPYNLNEWYDIKIVLDGSSKKYDLYLNGELAAANRDAAGKAGEGITAVRFAVCNNTQHSAEHTCSEIGASVCLDDIRISSLVDFPKIESVAAASGESISGGETDICVKFSGDIADADISKMLSIESEIGSMPIRAAVFNGDDLTLNISAAGVFQPNIGYCLKMKKGTKISSTIKTDAELQCVFNAEKSAADVAKSRFEYSGGKLEFEADIENTENEAADMLMIMYIWDNDRLVFANSKKISVGGNGTITERISSKPTVKGETAEVFIMKLPELDQPVTVKKFRFRA